HAAAPRSAVPDRRARGGDLVDRRRARDGPGRGRARRPQSAAGRPRGDQAGGAGERAEARRPARDGGGLRRGRWAAAARPRHRARGDRAAGAGSPGDDLRGRGARRRRRHARAGSLGAGGGGRGAGRPRSRGRRRRDRRPPLALRAGPMDRESGEAWGCERLAADRVGRRLPEADRPAAVRQALRAGREAARRLRAAHGTADPFALAARLRVAVSWSDEPPALGSLVRIAEYAPRPPAIRLFAESVRAVGAAHPPRCVAGIYVAHELYHHLEATGLEPAAAPARVTLARLGRWRWESGIRALSEIAAH